MLCSILPHMLVVGWLHDVEVMHSKCEKSQFGGRIIKTELMGVSPSSIDAKNGASAFLTAAAIVSRGYVETHTQINMSR